MMKKEINQNNTAECLSVKQVTKGKDDCISNDYIIDCEMDINLNGGVKESVEINSSFTNDEGTVLFAYKLDVLVG
ncbi:hypothetical protein EJB20_25635 (plasmid) [Klebsiella pneumoniae]|uniref:hypothetical protein n=1 Tax=Klebsiella pneumoniae TaxID=573 RepID=UPI0013EFFC24|nr:hypothetical protein [Klebsiella pneumoniae]QIH94797.1 hypothetical protein EJB20_25635 [Klebsiella pneumoniae]